jgi:hypothetical protein
VPYVGIQHLNSKSTENAFPTRPRVYSLVDLA